MGLIDSRHRIDMRFVSSLLLQIAKEPLKYQAEVLDAPEPPELAANNATVRAARLARQASATVISNCVVELWSSTVSFLHALEPDFPLYPSSVIKFIEESRLPFLSYMSLYYSMCEKKFEGTTSYQTAKLLVDMRHEIQHDKPETINDYSEERVKKVEKWKGKLETLIGKDAILWLPSVRGKPEAGEFTLMNESPIMKFMKYTIAQWAYDATGVIIKEMTDMMFQYQGQKKSFLAMATFLK